MLSLSLSIPMTCLALNLYHEARSEGVKGQLAVAEVTLNRVKSTSYPNTICGVVKQTSKNGCQFSWFCDGKSDEPKDILAWDQAIHVAQYALMDGVTLRSTQGSTHYHADYVRPYWAASYRKVAKIGRHIFYRSKT